MYYIPFCGQGRGCTCLENIKRYVLSGNAFGGWFCDWFEEHQANLSSFYIGDHRSIRLKAAYAFLDCPQCAVSCFMFSPRTIFLHLIVMSSLLREYRRWTVESPDLPKIEGREPLSESRLFPKAATARLVLRESSGQFILDLIAIQIHRQKTESQTRTANISSAKCNKLSS